MTVERKNNNLMVLNADEFDARAQQLLTTEEYNALKKYQENGGLQLAPSTAASFFELFLNGSSTKEIHALNSAFPYEAILWARIKYQWDILKDEHIMRLNEVVKERVMKAHLEAICLLSDMLTAANKKHGVKIKKFLQTGNSDDLGDALQINSIQQMLKVVEGLQKITGQDRVHKISTEETINVKVQSLTNNDSDVISTEAAAQILSIIAAEKRKK